MIRNQQVGASSGPTQKGPGNIDGSLTQNGLQTGNTKNGYPVFIGFSESNSALGRNMPSKSTCITKEYLNSQNQFCSTKIIEMPCSHIE
ncbi:hypothetical protein DPMN_081186 [Dreissena polymorpha]|uniref:Uncharacterized protein n=1 Tax=Dreissena polymorpha TaxID=45954 RepID=A0A9D3Y7K3_DREPO|nr:hypothetical protein DPMN_081186 [Dreissena polymorpha]